MNTPPPPESSADHEPRLPLLSPRRDLVAAAIQRRHTHALHGRRVWPAFAAPAFLLLLLSIGYLYSRPHTPPAAINAPRAMQQPERQPAARLARLDQRLHRLTHRPNLSTPYRPAIQQRLQRIQRRLNTFNQRPDFRLPQQTGQTKPKQPHIQEATQGAT